MEQDIKKLDSSRKLRKYLRFSLPRDDWKKQMKTVIKTVDIRITQPLFSMLYDTNPIISGRAFESFGILGEHFADQPENLRKILRRCIWTLTEESGGIPWGTPEAMAHLIVSNENVAKEYVPIYLAYIHNNDAGPEIYLDHGPLRSGIYLGMLVIAEKYPELLEQIKSIIQSRFDVEDDPQALAYLCILTTKIDLGKKAISFLKSQLDNFDRARIWLNSESAEKEVRKLADESLKIINSKR